jgi:very-short-patch-repair endonuclease/TusA-related sulfurtransferase
VTGPTKSDSFDPTERARALRRDQTDAERRLWRRLRDRQIEGAKFRRQHPVGPFIADFCCPERGLVIEVDGGQHAERAEADDRRTAFLVRHGYRVLRFWSNEVLQQMDAVLTRIAEALGHPHPNPLPGREREPEELDIRGEVCPYTFLRAKLALEPMDAGQVLRVVLGNETSARDVPKSLADAGHAVLGVEQSGDLWVVTVRKGA